MNPPDKCPACRYYGKKAPTSWIMGQEKWSRLDMGWRRLDAGSCRECGVVWWEHELSQAGEHRDEARLDAMENAQCMDRLGDELIQAGERIAKLEAVLKAYGIQEEKP